jgi:hypothetical protein
MNNQKDNPPESPKKWSQNQGQGVRWASGTADAPATPTTTGRATSTHGELTPPKMVETIKKDSPQSSISATGSAVTVSSRIPSDQIRDGDGHLSKKGPGKYSLDLVKGTEPLGVHLLGVQYMLGVGIKPVHIGTRNNSNLGIILVPYQVISHLRFVPH